MSFGRLKNDTLPTMRMQDDDDPASLELREIKNLKQLTSNTLDGGGNFIKKVGSGISNVVGEVKDFNVGALKAIPQGMHTGAQTFKIFWSEVFRDLAEINKPNTQAVSKYHFNMLKRGMTEDEKAYYKFLQLSDEELSGSYEDYLEMADLEAQNSRKEFLEGIDNYTTSKKEELKASDERGQELMEEYGVGAMLGYGFGQMLGNHNEMATNVMASFLGVKFNAGTGLLGMDDIVNVMENVMSNAVSEKIVSEATGRDFDYGDVATRTVATMLFMKGIGGLFKKAKNGLANKFEIRKIKEIESLMAQDVINAKTLDDAVERGLDVDIKGDEIKMDYPNDKARILTEEIGTDKYKAYKMKKIAEEFAYDEETGKGLTNTNRLVLTKSRKRAEKELRELLESKYGKEYTFEQYISDMDSAHRNAKFSELEAEKAFQEPTEVKFKDGLDREIDETQFLEEQDISMINSAKTEYDEATEVLGKDDTEIRSWFETNC